METSRTVIPGAPGVGFFFGSLRYNVVCEHGHYGWSPQPVDYVGEGFRECSAQSEQDYTLTGNPRLCKGKLRLLDAWELRELDV